MKIVINRCFGGFSLSALAIKRLAELNNKPCYFFKIEHNENFESIYAPSTLDDCEKEMLFYAYTVPNPEEYKGDEKWHTMSDKEREEQNKRYDETSLSTYNIDRTDKFLVQVVEELGKKANGRFGALKVVEIPDDIEWEIEEYDGMESIHEKHRSWQ